MTLSTGNGPPGLAAAVLAAAAPLPGDVSVPEEATLQQVVQAAVDHVGARYSALGVLSPNGRQLDRFVVAGIDEATRERIGRLPTGRGLLGVFLEGQDVLRVDDLTRHPSSVGFPPGHPPMRTLLSVPIRVGGAHYGNLYLTEKRGGGPFSEADAEAARTLAAVAGLAITNARLAERAERRRAWLQAASTISTALLTGADQADVMHAVAEHVARLAGAELSILLLPAPEDDDSLVIAAAVGEEGDDFEGVRFPLAGTVAGAVMRSGEPMILEDAPIGPRTGTTAELGEKIDAHYGPRLFVPLNGPAPAGVLLAARERGREPFEAEVLDLLEGFTTQVALALTLASSQDRARRLQVQADRDRIARDLHDHVVQRLFGTALSLDRLSRGLEDELPDAAERICRSVDELDSTIAEIRAAIFDLHHDAETTRTSLRARVTDLVRQITEGHPLRRDVRVRGPVDELAPELTPDLLAVVRELVTNVVRHAAATRVTVTVTVDDEVRVVVTDDGRGLYPGTERSGLANLGDRAARRGGRLVVVPRRPGTQVRWQVPRR